MSNQYGFYTNVAKRTGLTSLYDEAFIFLGVLINMWIPLDYSENPYFYEEEE